MAMFFRFFPSVFCLEMKIEMRLKRVAWNDKNMEKRRKNVCAIASDHKCDWSVLGKYKK